MTPETQKKMSGEVQADLQALLDDALKRNRQLEVTLHGVEALKNDFEDQLNSVSKERDELKEHEEYLAKLVCDMEDALGFKQDQHDKDGAFVPTIVPWKERVRDLIAAEGERDEARAKLAKLCLAIDPSSKHGPDVEGIIAHFNENIVRRDAKLAELQAELNKRTLTALNATADLKDVVKLISKQRSTAQAKCAEMRDALERLVIHFNEFYNDWRKGDFKLPKLAECDMESVEAQIPKAQHALSEECGKGWKSPDEWLKLESTCAEMRKAIEHLMIFAIAYATHPKRNPNDSLEATKQEAHHALSDDCGKGWVRVEELQPAIEVLSGCAISFHMNGTYPESLKIVKRELSRLEKLTENSK